MKTGKVSAKKEEGRDREERGGGEGNSRCDVRGREGGREGGEERGLAYLKHRRRHCHGRRGRPRGRPRPYLARIWKNCGSLRERGRERVSAILSEYLGGCFSRPSSLRTSTPSALPPSLPPPYGPVKAFFKIVSIFPPSIAPSFPPPPPSPPPPRPSLSSLTMERRLPGELNSSPLSI